MGGAVGPVEHIWFGVRGTAHEHSTAVGQCAFWHRKPRTVRTSYEYRIEGTIMRAAECHSFERQLTVRPREYKNLFKKTCRPPVPSVPSRVRSGPRPAH